MTKTQSPRQRTTHKFDPELPKDEWTTSKPSEPLRRTARETLRLRTLKALLDPTRKFLVERRVVLTTRTEETDKYATVTVDGKQKKVLVAKGKRRQFEERVFTVIATNGADASALADMAKFNLESQRGHHSNIEDLSKQQKQLLDAAVS
jgi:hypothetical protein